MNLRYRMFVTSCSPIRWRKKASCERAFSLYDIQHIHKYCNIYLHNAGYNRYTYINTIFYSKYIYRVKPKLLGQMNRHQFIVGMNRNYSIYFVIDGNAFYRSKSLRMEE